jgi:dTDP-glucose 4,6-dehydratase
LDPARLRPEKSEVLELICDNRKARENLDWEPKYSFDKGLEETIEWVRRNPDQYKSAIYNL